jgi:hypothetical protein
LPQVQQIIRRVGAFESLTFKGVGEDGWDLYAAKFANRELEWHIAPLSADGKVERRGFRIVAETPPAASK